MDLMDPSLIEQRNRSNHGYNNDICDQTIDIEHEFTVAVGIISDYIMIRPMWNYYVQYCVLILDALLAGRPAGPVSSLL